MFTASVLMATAILPGTGHLLLRRYLKGATLAVLYASAMNLLLLSTSPYLAEGKVALGRVCIGVMVLLWVFAAADTIRLLKSFMGKKFQSLKDDLLKAAQICWLRDELPDARGKLVAILNMDDRDIEAWVLLGKVYKSLGDDSEARRCFRSAMNLLGNDQWRWMLFRELGLNGENQPSAPLS